MPWRLIIAVCVLAVSAPAARADSLDQIEPPPGGHVTYQQITPDSEQGVTDSSRITQPTPTPTPTATPAPSTTTPTAPQNKPATKPATRTRTTCHGGRVRVCRTTVDGRLARTCTTRRGVRTCREYDAQGRLTRTCVKKGRHAQRCRGRLARASALGAARAAAAPHGRGLKASAASRIGGGFVQNPNAPVVRLYIRGVAGIRDNTGYCSGTLVRPGVLVTAGHCLWNNDSRLGFTGWFAQPFSCNIYAVPANNVNGTRPYGTWCVDDYWVPSAFTKHDGTQDMGYDWGIAYLRPDSSGHYPGYYTGTWPAYWNARMPYGTHIVKIGYPAEGAFLNANNGGGNAQYYCENTWDGGQWTWGGAVPFTGYMLYVAPCEMNGGSSGGPALVYFSDVKQWGLVGVNNVAHRGPQPDLFGQDGGSVYFDSRFGQLWNDAIRDMVARGL